MYLSPLVPNFDKHIEGRSDLTMKLLQADGERLPLAAKDLGSCDMYPGTLVHSPNGRFVAVCGDGEYIIYTALAWRNKSYGSALSFVWGDDSNICATRDSSSSVRCVLAASLCGHFATIVVTLLCEARPPALKYRMHRLFIDYVKVSACEGSL